MSEMDNVPVMTIQSDWEDFIEIPHKQIWVACKFRGERSSQGTLRGGTLLCDSAEFSATLGRNSICVRHNPSGLLCRFLPPSKVYKIHEKGVLSLDVANGGLGVSVCGANKLLIWDNSTGQVRRELIGHVGDIYKCKLFPSGIVVLSGGSDMRLKIWSAETGICPVTLTGHRAAISDFSFIDKGRNVLSVSKDGSARLWDCGESKCLATVLNTTDTLNCCCVGQLPNDFETNQVQNEREVGTQDKFLLAGSEEGRVYGVPIATRQTLFTTAFDSAINAIMYFSQSEFLVGTHDGKLQLCNMKDGSIIKIIHESNSPVLCLTAFKDRGVFVGRHDGTVTFYNLVSDTTDRHQLTGSDCDPVYSIAISHDAVFVACRDSTIRKYKVADIIAGGV